MQCPKCKQRVMENAKRCPACGASVKITFVGRLFRLLIPDQIFQQIKESSDASSVGLPEAKEGEFYLVVGSVTHNTFGKVMVNGCFSGNGELRKGDHVTVTLSDKTLKTCEVLKVIKVGDIFGIDVFRDWVGVVLDGITAKEIKVGDVVKKV